MNPEDLNRFLRRSLADRNLSGGEKAALAEWVERFVVDDQARGLARHAAFEAARTAITDPAGAEVVEWLEDVMKVLAPISPPPVADAPGSPRSRARSRLLFSRRGVPATDHPPVRGVPPDCRRVRLHHHR